MSTPPRRRLPLWIGVILVVLALGYGFRPTAVEVEMAEVIAAPLRATLREEGRTRVIDRFVVVSPTAGNLDRVVVEVGDVVAAGDPLFVLRPLPPTYLDARSRAQSEASVESRRSALAAATSRTESTGAAAELAERRLTSFEALFAKGDATELEVEEVRVAARQQRAAHRSAQFEAEVAEFELESAQATLARFDPRAPEGASPDLETLPSPVAGVVLRRFRESAGPVGAGEPIVEVGDASQLEIEVDVLSSDAVQLREGGRVQIERWGGETPLEGRIRRVEPVGFTKVSALGVEEQRVWVIVEFVTDHGARPRLGDGYRIDAVFVLWESDEARQVPSSALFRDRGEWAVYVDGDGTAEVRRVEVGHRSGLSVEILEGLDVGERVIVHPPASIESGSRIRER